MLAVGIAQHQLALAWPAAGAVGAGLGALLVEIGSLVARAPRGKTVVASRLGVAASSLHALLAFLLGVVMLGVGWREWAGIPHDRIVGIHLHLAAIGWLTLLIVAVGRTLGPMLAVAPAAPRRTARLEEAGLIAGLWLTVGGLAWGQEALLAGGGP